MTIEALRKASAAAARLGTRGAAIVEFAFVLPLLVLIITGMVQFGLALSNYVMLVNAVNAGALQFSISRASSTPYSGTKTVIQQAASALSWATLNPNITMSVNGTACTTNSACSALMTKAGLPVQVAATYPVKLVVAYKTVITFPTSCSATTNICASFTESLQ